MAHILRMKCAEMAEDRPRHLHMKFSALSVDFIAASSDSLGSRRAVHAGVKEGYPLKSTSNTPFNDVNVTDLECP